MGARGELLTTWNTSLFDCVHNWAGAFSLNVVLKRRVDGKEFLISNVYGPTRTDLKPTFFQELRDINAASTAISVVLGDFNTLLFVTDKNGTPTNTSEILLFRETINQIGLIDLPLLYRAYTWSNRRLSPTLERLDRALVSLDWHLLFPRPFLKALPRPRFDHCPLLLSTSTFVPQARIFRFESFWLHYPFVFQTVAEAWNATTSSPEPVSRLSRKLTNVRLALLSWSTGRTSLLRRQADSCLRWLGWLDAAEDRRELSQKEIRLRLQLKSRYEVLCLQEELYWK